MSRTFYTAGYTGHTPAELLAVAEKLSAIVFDARYRPFSRNPAWTGVNVAKSLGDRYRDVAAFGNMNYKGDLGHGVVLADFDTGRKLVEASEKPVILLCMCADRFTCHRNTIAGKLAQCGLEDLGEIEWPERPVTSKRQTAQSALF